MLNSTSNSHIKWYGRKPGKILSSQGLTKCNEVSSIRIEFCRNVQNIKEQKRKTKTMLRNKRRLITRSIAQILLSTQPSKKLSRISFKSSNIPLKNCIINYINQDLAKKTNYFQYLCILRESYYVVQAGFKLLAQVILLCQPPEFWGCGCALLCLVNIYC